jgi:hypothetical protein
MWLYHHNVIIIFPMKMRMWRVQPMFFGDIPGDQKKKPKPPPVHLGGRSRETTSDPWLAASQLPPKEAEDTPQTAIKCGKI